MADGDTDEGPFLLANIASVMQPTPSLWLQRPLRLSTVRRAIRQPRYRADAYVIGRSWRHHWWGTRHWEYLWDPRECQKPTFVPIRILAGGWLTPSRGVAVWMTREAAERAAGDSGWRVQKVSSALRGYPNRTRPQPVTH